MANIVTLYCWFPRGGCAPHAHCAQGGKMGTTANSGYTLGDISGTNVSAHAQAVPSELGVRALDTPPQHTPCAHHACGSAPVSLHVLAQCCHTMLPPCTVTPYCHTIPPYRPPSEFWAIAHVHKRQSAQKRRKKMGSSVAYKTMGPFLSQTMGHADASGQATEHAMR